MVVCSQKPGALESLNLPHLLSSSMLGEGGGGLSPQPLLLHNSSNLRQNLPYSRWLRWESMDLPSKSRQQSSLRHVGRGGCLPQNPPLVPNTSLTSGVLQALQSTSYQTSLCCEIAQIVPSFSTTSLTVPRWTAGGVELECLLSRKLWSARYGRLMG